MWYSCFTKVAIWVYNEKEEVFADISNPNTSTSKIIDLKRPFDECSEIAFSGRQNAENELCKSLKNYYIKNVLSSLDKFIQDIKCGIRVLLL